MGSINDGTYCLAVTWKIRTKYDSVVCDPGEGRRMEPEGHCVWGDCQSRVFSLSYGIYLKRAAVEMRAYL